ncbi:hypothetical protein [Pararhizobium haloflavum]|uniref:hypothetical protein n=1 Tax=Pararhizobium haloflavum TaxID=2037914 RepID=UPI000C17A91E|nr:hypothetical protein [Pararhizobium haloflavum]
MARYHGLRDDIAEAIDEEFGELVKIWPKKDGVTDPERANLTIIAVVRTRPEQRNNLAGGRTRNWNASVSAGTTELRIAIGRYPEIRLRRGDIVEAVEREGGPLFEVLSVQDRSHVRLIAELGEV